MAHQTGYQGAFGKQGITTILRAMGVDLGKNRPPLPGKPLGK